MSYFTVGRLILAGVAKSKIISKYGKKLYDRVKKEIKEMDRIDKAQGDTPSTKFLIGAGTVTLAGTAGIDKIRKKTNKKNKNPKLKVKNKKK